MNTISASKRVDLTAVDSKEVQVVNLASKRPQRQMKLPLRFQDHDI